MTRRVCACLQDDLKTQVGGLKKQLQEAQDVYTQVDSKLSVSLSNLRAAQEEKAAMEAELSSKQATLQTQVRYFHTFSSLSCFQSLLLCVVEKLHVFYLTRLTVAETQSLQLIIVNVLIICISDNPLICAICDYG
ncbi:hypothetical protein PR048_006569 [Dryococelus australis]|uniref:Uncharacterized protein n=1 Tax=Dryococelus australis TaxID=614101 RepID=A0ABQ9IBF4_9NEOP|nr:hypothetical protein PR048_006569 [Dryococelus australis]